AEGDLFPGKGLPGGGQLELRLTASIYTSDPEALEIAQRLKPYDLESWIVEHTRIAERNEQTAEKFASQGLNVTANEYYVRAANFYREAAWPQPVTEPRMLPTYKKARLMFDKAWDHKIARAPFERVQVNSEGTMLAAPARRPAGGAAGKLFSVFIPSRGADTMA